MEKERMTELVTAAKQGNEDALNRLLTEFYPQLYYFALKQVQNEQSAADICQDTCVSIITHISTVKDPSAFTVWAYRTVLNKAKRYAVISAREPQFEEDEDGHTLLDSLEDESTASLPEQVTEDKEFREVLQGMISSLPDTQRTALLLYYFENMSVSDICEIQGVSEGTVKSRLNYARKAVKSKVEEYEKLHNVKLHSISALIIWLFSEDAANTAALPLVLPAAATATAATATTAATAATASSFGVQILAGVIALTLLGGVAFGSYLRISTKNASGGNDGITETGVHMLDADSDSSSKSEDTASNKPIETESKPNTDDDDPSTYKYSDGLLYAINEDGMSYSVTGIGICTDTELNIPPTHDSLPVTDVANGAFFNNKSIIQVKMNDGIKSISSQAFDGCSSLGTVELPSTLEIIGEDAFASCPIEDISIPDSVRVIEWNAFAFTRLKNVTLPKKMEVLGSNAFSGCTLLESVTVQRFCSEFGNNIFDGCTALTQIKYDSYYSDIPMVFKMQLPQDISLNCKDGIVKRAPDWKTAYKNLLQLPTYYKPDSNTGYGLIYVDSNDTPELFIHGEDAASGECIITFHDGWINALFLSRTDGTKYSERSGWIHNYNGHMGHYQISLYILSKGEFSLIGFATEDWNEDRTSVYYHIDDFAGTGECDKETYDKITAEWNGYADKWTACPSYSNAVNYDTIMNMLGR